MSTEGGALLRPPAVPTAGRSPRTQTCSTAAGPALPLGTAPARERRAALPGTALSSHRTGLWAWGTRGTAHTRDSWSRWRAAALTALVIPLLGKYHSTDDRPGPVLGAGGSVSEQCSALTERLCLRANALPDTRKQFQRARGAASNRAQGGKVAGGMSGSAPCAHECPRARECVRVPVRVL